MPHKNLKAVLLEAFALESRELLTRIAAERARLEAGADEPGTVLQAIGRSVHTLKGASSTIGLVAAAALCRAIHDYVDGLVDGLRSNEGPGEGPGAEAIATLGRALDMLGEMCRNESPGAAIVDVLRSLSSDPGSWPEDVHTLASEEDEGADEDEDEDEWSVSASISMAGDPGVLPERARAVQFQFTALHAVWQDLSEHLTVSESVRTEFAAQFAAAMCALDRLTDTVLRTHAPARDARPADETMSAPDPLEEQGKRILVVDDSRTARTWVRDILETAGYTVYLATDGQEALDIIPSLARLDLLVTDLKMPRMDGTTLCQRVRDRAELARMPIVIVTSQSDDPAIEAGLQAGANAYIVKQDLVQQRFLQTVERLLH